jgi:hypothetical protein
MLCILTLLLFIIVVFRCYDGFPVSNINLQLYNVHQIQCAYAPKQVMIVDYTSTSSVLPYIQFLCEKL